MVELPQLPDPDPAFLELLRNRADAAGFLELPDFVSLALYHPQFGYYRQNRERVGRTANADFYTSTSLRQAFAAIILEASLSLLESAGLDPCDTEWVEIGGEPGAELLLGLDTPFKALHALRPGNPLEIPANAVVFSNELFDAQPFRQIRRENGRWSEYGVHVYPQQLSLAWQRRAHLSDEAASFLSEQDRDCPDGYTVDLPTGARSLAAQICSQTWKGAFIAFDYGKTWHALLHDSPQGSARAYFRHQQLPNILACPGQIDITHHICWDHLEAELATHGFQSQSLQNQESFVINRAPRFMQDAFDPSRSALDPIRSKLRELIHPSLMGQKFQALSAIRQ